MRRCNPRKPAKRSPSGRRGFQPRAGERARLQSAPTGPVLLVGAVYNRAWMRGRAYKARLRGLLFPILPVGAVSNRAIVAAHPAGRRGFQPRMGEAARLQSAPTGPVVSPLAGRRGFQPRLRRHPAALFKLWTIVFTLSRIGFVQKPPPCKTREGQAPERQTKEAAALRLPRRERACPLPRHGDANELDMK